MTHKTPEASKNSEVFCGQDGGELPIMYLCTLSWRLPPWNPHPRIASSSALLLEIIRRRVRSAAGPFFRFTANGVVCVVDFSCATAAKTRKHRQASHRGITSSWQTPFCLSAGASGPRRFRPGEPACNPGVPTFSVMPTWPLPVDRSSALPITGKCRRSANKVRLGHGCTPALWKIGRGWWRESRACAPCGVITPRSCAR